ncbi:hypothetical protein ACS0TY_027586 [Phlomoides rotata]
MSILRSSAVLESHELYSMKDGNIDTSCGLSTSMFGSDVTSTSESFTSDEPKYILDSPSQEFVHTNPLVASRKNAYELDYVLDCQSPDIVEYDKDVVNLKLQELENVLLDVDSDDHDQSMEIDGYSSSASIKEISFSTPTNLLFECAAAINNRSWKEASDMIDMLRQKVSIQGEPTDRIAAYMVEALAARMATSGRGLYNALKCKSPPSDDRLSAMQVLFEACPCFRFGFMAANGVILEACKDENRVHIIDFDINQGSQYYTLLQTLAKTSGNRPHVRLTGVDDPESVQRGVGGLNIIGQRLEQLAQDLNLSFEFNAVAAETALVSPSLLRCEAGEALVVNFAFQLHHLPDESVSTVNMRDQLLRMVKSLEPKLVTLVEQDVNTNTAPFLTRFAEAYNYYSAVFASLDATLGRENQDRINVEKHCLARDIINVVACEGEERIERYEVAGKWRARMSMAGFRSCSISENVYDEIRSLIKQYSDQYKVKQETGSLHFGWKDKMLILSSAWK